MCVAKSMQAAATAADRSLNVDRFLRGVDIDNGDRSGSVGSGDDVPLSRLTVDELLRLCSDVGNEIFSVDSLCTS